jgi:DNA polymerase-3 subunit epsilon
MTMRKRTLYWTLAALFAGTAIYAPFTDNTGDSPIAIIGTMILLLALAALFAHLARTADPDKTITIGKGSSRLPRDYTSIDIETTGLPGQDPRIIELGAVRIRNGKPTATYSHLIDPGKPIPAKITSLTGIDDAMVAGMPAIGSELKQFLRFCGSDTLIGHNIDRFDLPIIQAEAHRNGISTPSPATIDTLPLAQRLCPELGRHRVIDLIQAFGIATTESHRATDDALQTAQIYETLRKRA